ncbi:MAG: hypothetical protein K2X47_11485 [Bdellovibrionales bacterium]|nr:hypothetical protein [Bdellovibrionales bacterium]
MLEKLARIGTIFSLLCLGWLIPGMFAPPTCSKSSLVQSFDIADLSAESRVWNCALDDSGKDIALDHQRLIRDFENKLQNLQTVVRWYGLPMHSFHPQFQLSKSSEEMETDLVAAYLKAQPELAVGFQKILPRLTIATFGHFRQRAGLWSPLATTLQNARMDQQIQKEKDLSIALRLQTLERAGEDSTGVPIPSLTVMQIDSRLTEVYAHWNGEKKILYVKGPVPQLHQAAPWFGATLFIQSEETAFSDFLKGSKSAATMASVRKVLWTPSSIPISDSLIYLLSDKGSQAFAAKSPSSLPFVEIYLPGLKHQPQLQSNLPLLKQLLVASTFDKEVHQPLSARDLVTLYRWPPTP